MINTPVLTYTEYKEQTREVTEFIERRFPDDSHWLDGNCYYFACILKDRFGGRIKYDTVYGHFVCSINGILYDHTGEYRHKDGERFYDWQTFSDRKYKRRIRRDCIL